MGRLVWDAARCADCRVAVVSHPGSLGQEVATILVGLWLIASPYALGYSGEGFLRIYHTSLGAVAVILGVLQLWQDWDLNDQDMLKHGQ
jgi:hypothetical protein